MKYKAVIFDLDGVICFTDEYHYLAWQQIADEEHIYFDREINKRLRGVSRMDSLNIVLEQSAKEYSKEEKKQLAKRKNDIYLNLLDRLSEKSLAEGAKETLLKISQLGLKTAIASSSRNAKFILKKLGLDSFFDSIADGTIISHSKPHPEVFIKAVDLLNERPCECLVVEDAAAGIEAASHGGFDSAGLGDAQNSLNVTYKIEKLEDLLNIVQSE